MYATFRFTTSPKRFRSKVEHNKIHTKKPKKTSKKYINDLSTQPIFVSAFENTKCLSNR